SAKVAHAHPACGNGVAWWLEMRTPARSAIFDEGAVDLGKTASVEPTALRVSPGDQIVLAIDARDRNHVCDLTQIEMKVTQLGDAEQIWDLAADLVNSIHDGNPHADSLGNAKVWSIAEGPSEKRPRQLLAAGPLTRAWSQWRSAAADPQRHEEATRHAERIQGLLMLAQNSAGDLGDAPLRKRLLTLGGPLLRGIDLERLVGKRQEASNFGMPAAAFGQTSDVPQARPEDLVTPLGEIVELQLPAMLLREMPFVVDAVVVGGELPVARVELLAETPAANTSWDGSGPLLVNATAENSMEKINAGFAEFRQCFPTFICFPQVIPTDEVVCLKTFHREDEPLKRLFLSAAEAKEIDRLWEEHRFISHFPTTENEYLPLFIGFVTQDQTQETLKFFEGFREPFGERAAEFEAEFANAAPPQLTQLYAFAARAYRRPLTERERAALDALYRTLRARPMPHDEAFRGVLARVFISPSFLMHVERTVAGKSPIEVDDWELASRLSYFLWSSQPDDELRGLAAAGRLHDSEVLAAQARRMLRDERVRALAIEFGTQWIHVRGFDQLDEKNEKLFPEFDASLRQAIYEESILFFQHLFQENRPPTDILAADYAFLNERLAQHYGVPQVQGDQWRRVDGVRAFGRGGILGLASVHAKQAGASRTSPVLRGNWVAETLLGEKLPLPPPNVPQLPEAENGNDGLTMRALVEKHVRAAECAVCHVRIDPLGFALERYDPIGRRREFDLGGLPLDTTAQLRDGTRFAGIEGLREYLLTTKRKTVLGVFCRRLLGYALARETTLSDTLLIDQMVEQLNSDEGRLGDAVRLIVLSPQFRSIRGADYEDAGFEELAQ
ncbi:MAG: DUF1592 domain-containing protein, partial [Planctomycetales bacterium]|nr:DUF1592 domain-containing protein [Planctomycetales bacterium]